MVNVVLIEQYQPNSINIEFQMAANLVDHDVSQIFAMHLLAAELNLHRLTVRKSVGFGEKKNIRELFICIQTLFKNSIAYNHCCCCSGTTIVCTLNDNDGFWISAQETIHIFDE